MDLKNDLPSAPDSSQPAKEPSPVSNAQTPAPAAGPESAGEVLRRLGPAGPLAICAAVFPALGGFLLLVFLYRIGPWLRSHQELGVLLYVVGFAVFSGLALLPTYAQAILGGWAFGFAAGLPAALGGFFGGGLIGYLIAHRASGDRVVRLIGEHPKWKAVYDALLGGGFGKTLLIVTLLRLPPNSPFAMTNLVLAATRVSLPIYLIGTLIGMTPRTALAVYLAAGLKELDFTQHDSKWVFIGGIGVALIVIAILGHFAQKAIAKVTAGENRA